MNQFSHNFKENEQIFDRLKLKLTVSHSIDKMNIFEAKSAFSKDSLLHCDHIENYIFYQNEQFSVVLSSGHQNEHFQGIACSRLVYLYQILWILRKLIIFSDLHEIYAF